jgi:hypothetical protein
MQSGCFSVPLPSQFFSGVFMRKIMKIVVASVVALVVAACSNPKDANKANFSKAIQAYLDTQTAFCLYVSDLPYVQAEKGIRAYDEKLPQKLNAFVEVGLLSARNTEVKAMFGNKMVPATEYQATELGKQYLSKESSGRFCTGKRKLTGVDNFTEPGPAPFSNVTASEVNFRYEITDLAEWAKSEKVRAAYDERAFKALEENQDKAVLILTNEGWMHGRLFRNR